MTDGTDTFDPTREPLRAIRDLIVACESILWADRHAEHVLARAQAAFTCLRAIHGDTRPAEQIAEADLREPAQDDIDQPPDAAAMEAQICAGDRKNRPMSVTPSDREWVALGDDCIDARDIDFKGMPDGVIRCHACGGNGKCRQNYIEGRMTGRCELCDASGFVYQHTGRAVPISVTNQIAVATGVSLKHFPIYGNDWRQS